MIIAVNRSDIVLKGKIAKTVPKFPELSQERG